ncbi:hypothetical protein N7457_003126 [Penicillium paradoxum]|uniref:uncharacterized protein n=1 Tax=Penicillium paradoxum TaxID=176176 RepID=UPI002547F4B2|nr:uncharacterized protein N7457_003126 [Penicillium paradoxum]KAJ5788136.1 hypothetical protein N7457_003126 [Penicillium paradoxum]
MSIRDIWYAIQACTNHRFNYETLKPWFRGWVKRIRKEQPAMWTDEMFNRQLLFPCYFFDHATGFRDVTRYLVYNMSFPIKDSNPIFFDRKRLRPKCFIRSLNKTRAQLPAILQCKLFGNVDKLLNQDPCACNEAAICTCLKEIKRVGIRPFGDSLYKGSIRAIVDRLELFDPGIVRKLDPKPCHCGCFPRCGCTILWRDVVKLARKEVLEHFSGFGLNYREYDPKEDFQD